MLEGKLKVIKCAQSPTFCMVVGEGVVGAVFHSREVDPCSLISLWPCREKEQCSGMEVLF